MDCALMYPLTRRRNWPRPGGGKRTLALGVLLGEAAGQRRWHARSGGSSG